MGERRAEDRHDVVADMFVDRAAETLHDGVDDLEKPLEQSMDLFRIEPRGKTGVADEIAETGS